MEETFYLYNIFSTEYELFFTIFFSTLSLQLRHIISLHQATCPSSANDCLLQLSSDGVSESRSTSVSLDIYSVKFQKCRTIYPLRIVRPVKKVNIDHNEQLRATLIDIHDNGCRLWHYVGDNLKRAISRVCLCHSSWFPCEYCFSKGTKVITNDAELAKKKKNIETQRKIVCEKINALTQSEDDNDEEIMNLKNIEKELIDSEKKLRPKKTNIVWPPTTANGAPRTEEKILEIIEKIENDQEMTIDEAKGITGRSPLVDIPYFNFVTDIPVDYLHCACLGVVKRCVCLTFKVGDVRVRVTKRPLSSPALFNRLILLIKVPREYNRRVRELDFAVYKGQEYRNLILVFFPLVLECIEDGAKERNIWLYLAYMVRACVIPTEEYEQIENELITTCMSKFYSIYEQTFGIKNCTYNTHILGSHLPEMRFHGPLTLTSAFPFESFYGEVRQSFVPGTVSPLKQILANVLIKRAITNHCCVQDIYISNKDTAMECNSLIYCFRNDKYEMYKVKDMIDKNTFICNEIDKMNYSFQETPELNWSLVGVFKKSASEEQHEDVVIEREEVKGKIVMVNDFLITCPSNVLREK